MGKVATAKQTGQGGTSYEDKVIAHFLACMLCESLPFGPEFGLIKRISLQARADGWLFDDILLQLDPSKQINRIAISVKSNRQFNTKGCPAEVNSLLWEQYLHHNTSVFNKDFDRLCLVQAPISMTVVTDLNKLLQQAVFQDTEAFHRRVFTQQSFSKSCRKIYESFYCPPYLASVYGIRQEDTGNLLKCFLHHEMDFENITSKDEIRTIELCRDALKNKKQADAERLYRALSLLPRTISPAAGSLDRKALVQLLKNDFVFSNAPAYESDWKKLYQIVSNKFSIIPNKLGQNFELDRRMYISDLENAIFGFKGLIIQGISGCGKTNLAKLFAEAKREGGSVIWLDSTDFDSDSIEADMRLDNPLSELIEETSDSEAYLFIDGVERLFHEREQQKLAIILKKTLAETSPWKVVFTCPSDQIDKLRQLLIKFDLTHSTFQDFEIPKLTFEELYKIASSYPVLKRVLFTSSMENIWNNLKLLDKLIRNSKDLSSLSTTSNLGESHLIDFVWYEEVENGIKGLQTSSFLKRLSEQQADHLSVGISTHLYSSNELAPADELRSMGFLRLHNEKLYFNHDLYSDWARYKLIKSHGDDLPGFLKEKYIISPLWAKAVRLYGISLLEQQSSGMSWQKVFTLFDNNSPQNLLVQDLLLEAFFFAPNAYSLLILHKELLFANEATLLKRITKLFLLRATRSDPRIIELAKEIGITEKQASAYERLPIVTYWPEFLKFLDEESEIGLKHDLINIVTIASLWLEKTPANFPMRQSAGDLSLKGAKQIFSLSEKGRYIDEKIEEPVYKALLLGYVQNPKEVKDLCLRICKRTKATAATGIAGTKNDDGNYRTTAGRTFSINKPEPWPLGPSERVDNAFRKVCLEGRTLFPILEHDPQLGTEILLAVLIEEPDKWPGSQQFDDHYQIIEEHTWYPPFYLRGPFLNFLRISPPEALSFICKLIDFATDRWRQRPDQSQVKNRFEITIEGKPREYFGDFRVFAWHKDIGNAPHSLVSILMALEQFFYEELEKEKNIDVYVSYLLKNTKSLAIIGVLFTIGKLHTPLFLQQMKPFLSEYLFYEWDTDSGYHNFGEWLNDFSKGWQNDVKKWRERTHRNYSIRNIILHLLLNYDMFQKDFVSIREKWQKELTQMISEGRQDIFLYQLIHQLNPSNYEKKTNEDVTYFDYKEPAEVTDQLAEGRKVTMENLQDSQMAYKCQLMIEQKLPFELAGAAYLWKKILDDYSKIDVESDSHCSGQHAWASPYTNVLAGVKVLVHHKSIWVDQNPEYLEWIQRFIESLINKQFSFDGQFEHSGTDMDWNILLAGIVPVLWKNNTKDKCMRRAVTGILSLFNNATIKSFFASGSLIFRWDDPNFIQAQNLLLSYSGEYYRYNKEQSREIKELKIIRERLAKEFTEDKVQPGILEWSSIRAAEEWKPKEVENWQRKSQDYVRRAGMDTRMIGPMIENIPVLHSINEKQEKAYIVLLLEQAFNQVIYQLGEIREDSLAIRSLESEFDRIVLRKIGGAILYLENDKEEKKFWEPLIRFGYIAQNWIRSFCNSFFVNLDSPDIYNKMVKLLNETVEYTYTSPTWATRHIKRSEDYRICMLGFHTWMRTFWKHDYSAFTSKAEHIYKKWFHKNHINPYVIDALLDFIITPSGAFMLQDGLEILTFFFSLSLQQSQQKVPEGMVWVGNKDLDDKLASTLSTLWQYHKVPLKKDNQSYRFYRELIQYLIAIKNIVGIELQNSLVEE